MLTGGSPQKVIFSFLPSDCISVKLNKKAQQGLLQSLRSTPAHTVPFCPPALGRGPGEGAPLALGGFATQTPPHSEHTKDWMAGGCPGQLRRVRYVVWRNEKHCREPGGWARYGRTCTENAPKGSQGEGNRERVFGGGAVVTPGPRAGGAPRPTAELVQGRRVP